MMYFPACCARAGKTRRAIESETASGRMSWGPPQQDVATPLKRRSERKSAAEKPVPDSPILAPVMKRSITVRKILPRKTLVSNPASAARRSPRVPSKAGKENTEEKDVQTAKEKRGERSVESKRAISGELVLQNPISVSFVQNSTSASDPLVELTRHNVRSPIPANVSAGLDERDSIMAKKVRRSYSRLEMSLNCSSFLLESCPAPASDSSGTSTPNLSRPSRLSFFGFDTLAADVLADVSPVTGKTRASQVSVLDAPTDASVIAPHAPPRELDTNIPGIAVAKEKRKRRRVPQIDKSDLDEWAAQMNAQFEEAEKFDLLVE